MDTFRAYLQKEAIKYGKATFLNTTSFGVRIGGVVVLTEVSLRHQENIISSSLALTSLLFSLMCLMRISTSEKSLQRHGYSSAVHEKMICDLFGKVKKNIALLQRISAHKVAAIGGTGIGLLMSTLTGITQFASHNFGEKSLKALEFAPHYLLALTAELLVINALNLSPDFAQKIKQAMRADENVSY